MTSPHELSDPPTTARGPLPQNSRAHLPNYVSRLAALTGLAGVVFYAIGVFLPGSAPKPDATTAQVVGFFVRHRSPLLTGFALQLIALALLLCFLGQLSSVIASAGGTAAPAVTTMTAGWVILITIVAVSTLPAMAVVWGGAASSSSDLVRAAYDMQTLGTYAVSSTAAMVSIAAPSIIIWRRRILPTWLAVLGGAEVVANVVELVGLSYQHGTLAGGYADGIGLILWVIWVGAASGCIALRLHDNRQTAR
jgi:hypothetical protein